MQELMALVLPVFKVPGYNILDQVDKVLEEAEEVSNAIEYSEPMNEILIEALDVIQATVNLITMLGPTEAEIDNAYSALLIKHMRRGYCDGETVFSATECLEDARDAIEYFKGCPVEAWACKVMRRDITTVSGEYVTTLQTCSVCDGPIGIFDSFCPHCGRKVMRDE